MKKFLILAALSCIALASNAQFGIKPYSSPKESWSQMWNVGKVYYPTPSASNLGDQKDTVKGSTTVYLYTASLALTSTTFAVTPAPKNTSYTITTRTLKVAGSPTSIQSLVSSTDGVNWGAVPGAATYTVTPTSLTVPVVTKWEIARRDVYLGVKLINTDTTMTQAGFLGQSQ